MNTVVAELRSEGDGLRARVYVIRDGNIAGGTRELTAPTSDCAELAAAVALAISIAVDPDALDRVEPSAATEAPAGADAEHEPKQTQLPSVPDSVLSHASPPAEESAATTTKSATPGANARSRGGLAVQGNTGTFNLGAAVSAGTGPGPVPVYGAALLLGFRWRDWSIAIEPAATVPSTSDGSASGSKVRVWSVGGDLAVGRFWGSAFAGVLFELAVLNAEGRGVDTPRASHPALASGGLRVALDWRLTQRWSLVPRVDALFGLSRIIMQVDHSDGFETPRMFVRLGLGVQHGF
jgi:hypothetical protein